MLFKLVVYSPLTFTGYFICTCLLDKKASGLLWIGLSLGFGLLIYFILLGLKAIILNFKAAGNYWWIPVFIFCLAYTCLLPAFLVYEPLNQLVLKLNGNGIITFILELGFATFVYFQYDFLGHVLSKGD